MSEQLACSHGAQAHATQMMLARAAGPPSLGGTRLQGMAWRRNLWVTCRAGRQQPGWKGTLKFWQESSVSKAGEVSRDRIREAAREQAEEALKLDQSLELKQRSSLGEEDQMYNSSRGPAYNGLPSGRQALLQEVAQDLLARAQEVIFRTNGGDERQYSGLLRFRYKVGYSMPCRWSFSPLPNPLHPRCLLAGWQKA